MLKISLVSLTIGTLCATSHYSISYAATWRCEEKASAGFNSDSGYKLLEYRADKYIISTEVHQEQFAEIFWDIVNWSENLKPAGLTVVGDNANYLLLCKHFEWSTQGSSNNSIKCENNRYFSVLEFNLHTGLFTAANLSFGSSDGGSSSISVGECVRID
jgi:hypothetical protein